MAIATFVLALKTRKMATATEKAAVATKEMVAETQAVATATLQEANAVEKQVEQVEHQVTISANALRVNVQPWLIWEPSFEIGPGEDRPFGDRNGSLYLQGWHPCLEVTEQDDGSVVGSFTVRNVGNGIALLDMASSLIYPKNEPHAYEDIHPSVETPVVPPRATVDVQFTIPASKSHDRRKMTLVQFAGGGGNQLFAVEVAYGDSLGGAGTSATFRAHRHNENDVWSIFAVDYRLDNGKVISARKYGY
jgi:hypothetical protein